MNDEVLEQIRSDVKYTRELLEQRLTALEAREEDHEVRIRDLQEGVTQFRFWCTLSNGLSLSALLKLFFK